MKTLATLIILISWGFVLHAQIINVPGDQPTIQAGIDAVSDGDTVLVSEDTYLENIRFNGKAITVASHFILDGDTSHISRTIIDGSQPVKEDSASVVLFGDGEDSTSVLCGLTITGGTGTRYTHEIFDDYKVGLGVYIDEGSGGKIEHCIIRDNHLENDMQQWGGGICIMLHNNGDTSLERSVIIQENIIRNNSLTTSVGTGNSGGGIKVGTGEMKYGRLIIQNNIIESNTVTNTNPNGYAVGGGICLGMSIPTPRGEYCVRNNIFAYNKVRGPGRAFGGGIYSNSLNFKTSYFHDVVPAPFFYNNLICKNEADKWGGGIFAEITLVSGSQNFKTVPQAVFVNNTIVDNKAQTGSGLYSYYSKSILINNILRNDLSFPGATELLISGINIFAFNNLISDCLIPYGNLLCGYGNICGDPYLTEEYHLSDSSLCVGRGIDSVMAESTWYFAPAKDSAGNDRPNSIDPYVDIGAYESPFSTILLSTADLVDITLSRYHLSPNFHRDVLEYSIVMIDTITSQPALDVIPEDPLAQVDINHAADIFSEDPADRTTTITVTSSDGTTEKVYRIEFYLRSTVNTLSSLEVEGYTLDPPFDPDVASYSVEIPDTTTVAPSVSAIATNEKAEVKIYGATLADESHMKTSIIVTPEAGRTFNGQYDVTFDWIVDVPKYAGQNELMLYPNPVTEILTIQMKASTRAEIEITSLNGQLIFSGEMEGTIHQIDLSSFQKGAYYITIRSEDFVATRKVIKL